MARVFIIHGWSGKTDGKDWLPWAKKELEDKGYEVIMPSMPDADYPKIETWVPFLASVVGEPQQDVLIGHSMGCQAIMRYLETLPEDKKVDKVILVAGFADHLKGLNTEEQDIAKPWLETPINWEKIRTKANAFVAIFSDNDPFVSLEENKEVFEEKLGAKIIIEHNKGHFDEENKITKLPILLEVI